MLPSTGASGYLNKQSAPTLLVTAIRQVAGGLLHQPAVAEHCPGPSRTARPPRTRRCPTANRNHASDVPGKTLTGTAEMHLSVKTVASIARACWKNADQNNSELTHYAEESIVD